MDYLEMLDRFMEPGMHLGDYDTSRKTTYRMYDHDGAVIEYLGHGGKRNFALSFGNEYLPFAKDADKFESGTQIVGVYDYPAGGINEAFWNQNVDEKKLKPLWKKDFSSYMRKIDSIDKKIAELKKKRDMYHSLLPQGAELKN